MEENGKFTVYCATSDLTHFGAVFRGDTFPTLNLYVNSRSIASDS